MKRKNILIMISALAFIIIIGGVSYSYFVYNKNVGNVSLTTGEISIDLSGINGNQTLSNAVPTTDLVGKNSSEYFDFTVTGTVDTEKIYYEVYLMPKSGNTLDTSHLKTYLTDQSNNELKGVTIFNSLQDSEVENGKVIYNGVIDVNNDGTKKNETKNFRLRLWIDDTYNEINSKTFAFDIFLFAKNVDDDYSLGISSCPDCQFMYSTTTMYTTWNNQSQTPTVLTSGLYDDYRELITSTGKNYFLGVKLNNNNEVTNAYACGVKDGVPFCIEGTLYEAPETATAYATNKVLLQGTELYNNTCTVHIEEEGTANEYERLECGPWDNTGSLSAEALSSGNVSAGVGDNGYCYMNYNGYFECRGSESPG